MNLTKRTQLLLGLIALIGVMILGTSTLEAQLTTATLSGTVTDASGGVIPGASVSVLHVETGSVRSTVSDDEGRYRVPLLQPGSYEVSAELVGFQTAVRSGITLQVGGRAVIDLSLNVGEITERVVVQGEAPLVETTDTTLSGLVDDKKIRDLPLNGRSFEDLAVLQPGVSIYRHAETDSTVGTGTKFSVGGSRPAHNNFMLDGLAINDAASSSPGSAGGNNLGVESIREFKVLTNTYSAAYGRNSGATINVVTKSGTNQLHGSLFGFHRNSVFDARNFFDADPANPNERADPPSFKRNQFGFSLGGPIKQDKTFIFGNYEGLREGKGLTNIAIVSNDDARAGFIPTFDANGNPILDPNGDPVLRQIEDPRGNPVPVDPSVEPFLAFFPHVNGRDFGDGTGEFLSSPTRVTNEDYFVIRFDHEFNENNSFFARYSFSDGEQITPDSLVAFQTEFTSRNQSYVMEERTIISPTFINTARVGFSRNALRIESACITSCPDTFIAGRQFGKFRFGQAQSGPAPVTTYGTENPALAPYTTYQFGDDINLNRGAHAIQAGATVTRIQNNTVIKGTSTNGSYVFNSLENFLTAYPDQFGADTPLTNRHRGWRQTHVGFYIQDDFNYSPQLTFNLGLRWEFVTEISEVNGRQSQLVNRSDSEFKLDAPLFNFTGHQIQPRIGIAWDPRGDGKTAIRAGAGIFHNQLVAYWYNLAGSSLNPFSKSITLFPFSPVVPNFRIPFPDAFDLIGETTTPTILPVDPEADVPMVIHYNLNIQQELTTDTVLTVGYVGSRGTHLPRASDGNPNVFSIDPDGSKRWRPVGFLPRINRNFNLSLSTVNDVNSFYNSLQVGLNKRFSNNFQYQISYTWAHSIDDGSQQLGSEGRTSPQNHTDIDNRKKDRGHSIFDVRNNFVANATFDLPFGPGERWGSSTTGFAAGLVSGWQINAIVAIADGSPVSVINGFRRSNNGDFLNPGRPDLVPGADNNPVLGGPDRYYDSSSFVIQEAGTLGDLARTTLIGPGYANLDFAITKETELAGGDQPVNLQFRAEFFNILNRANFGFPDPTLFEQPAVNTDTPLRRGAAGRITKTVQDSRQIQFGLKIIF
jgi:hypothetical protein